MTSEMGLCDPDAPTHINPNHFYATPGTPEANTAMALCAACPLRDPCSEYAINQGIAYGIWGGMGKEERRQVWKRMGVRPSDFIDGYESQLRPLFQERRDHETFDERYPAA